MKLLGVLAVLFLFMGINGLLLMVAWNYVMPYLFKLPEIGFIQAYALVLVANALIKGHIISGEFKG